MFGFKKRANLNDLQMHCIRGVARCTLVIQKLNASIAKQSSSAVDRYQKGEIELAKIQVEGIYNDKRMLFVIQLLQVYLQTLSTRVDILKMEDSVPKNMEACIGSILACKGKVEIDELSPVRLKSCCHP